MQDKMTQMRRSIEARQEAAPHERHRELTSTKVKAGVWIDHRQALIVLMTVAGKQTGVLPVGMRD